MPQAGPVEAYIDRVGRKEDDLELLQRCIDRAPGSWQLFVDRFAPTIKALAARFLRHLGQPGDDASAEDVVQEVFLALTRRDYKLLRFGEDPTYIVDFVETPQGDGPFGARGLGEQGIIGMPGALSAAFSAAAGTQINQLPITPELLWRGARAAAADGSAAHPAAGDAPSDGGSS